MSIDHVDHRAEATRIARRAEELANNPYVTYSADYLRVYTELARLHVELAWLAAREPDGKA